MRAARLILVAALPFLVAACDDLPTELVEPSSLHATELGLRASVPPYSRSALFREAVDQVARTDGLSALWQQTAALRTHAAAARTARARGDVAAQRSAETAHRRARIRFTASVLGDARIDDVHREVRMALDAARVRLEAADGAGLDVARAASFLDEATAELAQASGTPARILAAAADAADALERMDQLLQSVHRLPTMNDLFTAAIADVRRDAGPAAARAVLADYQTLVREAEHAVADGGRVRAHERLGAARAQQVRIVARHLGPDGVARHIARVRAAEQTLAAPMTERRRRFAREYVDQALEAYREADFERALERAALAGDIVSALGTGR